MFKNNTPLGFIDFKNRKIVSDIPDRTNSEDSAERNKDFVMTYTSLSNNENLGSIKIEYDKNTNAYNYLNFTGQNLIILPNITGTARCKCCKSRNTGQTVGYTQSDNYLCQQDCIKDGDLYNSRYGDARQCCSLNTRKLKPDNPIDETYVCGDSPNDISSRTTSSSEASIL